MPLLPATSYDADEVALSTRLVNDVFDNAVFNGPHLRRASAWPVARVERDSVVARAQDAVADGEVLTAVDVDAVLLAANREAVEDKSVEIHRLPAVLATLQIEAGEVAALNVLHAVEREIAAKPRRVRVLVVDPLHSVDADLNVPDDDVGVAAVVERASVYEHVCIRLHLLEDSAGGEIEDGVAVDEHRAVKAIDAALGRLDRSPSAVKRPLERLTVDVRRAVRREAVFRRIDDIPSCDRRCLRRRAKRGDARRQDCSV